MSLIIKNKKAYFDYDIKESLEAGLELKGHEVKSIRSGQVNLKGSYITSRNGELFIKNMHISAWKALPGREKVKVDYDRKIFLHKKKIVYLTSKLKEKGFSIIPLKLYLKGSLIKLEVGLVKGKKTYQKKQILKERTLDREASKLMKKYY